MQIHRVECDQRGRQRWQPRVVRAKFARDGIGAQHCNRAESQADKTDQHDCKRDAAPWESLGVAMQHLIPVVRGVGAAQARMRIELPDLFEIGAVKRTRNDGHQRVVQRRLAAFLMPGRFGLRLTDALHRQPAAIGQVLHVGVVARLIRHVQ